MSIILITSVAFVGGMICGELKSWKFWMPAAAISGLTVGLMLRFMGVS